MHKILQNHLLCTFVANLKIGVVYALYPETFCDKNLAFRKVFAFCNSAVRDPDIRTFGHGIKTLEHQQSDSRTFKRNVLHIWNIWNILHILHILHICMFACLHILHILHICIFGDSLVFFIKLIFSHVSE